MKRKRLNKKLTLGKSTVANLNGLEMRSAHGGGDIKPLTPVTCGTCLCYTDFCQTNELTCDTCPALSCPSCAGCTEGICS